MKFLRVIAQFMVQFIVGSATGIFVFMAALAISPMIDSRVGVNAYADFALNAISAYAPSK